MIEFTREALRYASFGWRVFPLVTGSKLPAIKGGHGVKDASAYPADIRPWGRLYPQPTSAWRAAASSSSTWIRAMAGTKACRR
jgi:hypothetical protein